jgi:hypothetical protein
LGDGDLGGDSLGTIQDRSSHDDLGNGKHSGDALGTMDGRSSHDELGNCEHGGDSLSTYRVGHHMNWSNVNMVVML